MSSVLEQIKNLSPEKRALALKRLKEKARSRDNGAALKPRATDVPTPLSFAQRRLWFLDQMEGGSAHYNEFGALQLTGPLDVPALNRSINHIIRRHEILRTTFADEEGDPVQIVHPAADLEIPLIDISNFARPKQRAEIERVAARDASRPFNLASGPLLRITLLRLAERSHMLLFTIHHIVCDRWSMAVLNREFTHFYRACSNGQFEDLPPLPIQYADFAAWQRARHQGANHLAALDYWKQRMASAPALLELPSDRPRPRVKTYDGSSEIFQLDEEITSRLKKLGQRHGCTLFMTLLAAFKTLVYRYTGQTDVVVGSPVANRNRRETESLIGFFVNNLLLRTDLSGNPTFSDYLVQVRQVCLDAYRYQDVPFEQLVEALQPERNLSYTPLFQVVFSLQNATAQELEIPGVKISPVQLNCCSAKFDLNVLIEETAAGLAGKVEYSTDLFEGRTIRRLLQDFRTLLHCLASNPAARLMDIPLVSCADYERQLAEWHGHPESLEQTKCLHEFFEEQAEVRPSAIAVTFMGESLTYADLNARSNQLAHYLQSLGVGAEALVGLCVQRSMEMVIGVLGILKAGGAYLPLDPDYPEERLAFMLNDARAAVVVTSERLVASLPKTGCRYVCLDRDCNQIASESTSNAAKGVVPQNLAYVIYTSGSTGQPKGVLVSHANVTRLMAATELRFHFDENDVWTLFHSHAFDFSVWEIWGALAYGGRLVIVPYLVSRSPEAFHELLAAEGVTVLNQTPSAFRQLIQVDQAATADLALRYVIFGGEALELPSLKPWFDRYGDRRPRLVNMYGITETTVHVTYRALSLEDLRATASVIGGPLPDLQIHILNEQLQPAPVGVTGEIYIGGAGLTRGYLKRPDLTADRFIPSPFGSQPGARLYKTGDLARFRDGGEIEYLGRADNQVKIRGFRIELGEIESRLNQHPQLREAIVLLRPDDRGERRLVAYIVPENRDAPATEELRRFLLDVLPDYMVPAQFVTLNHIPLTPHGKVDRRALPEPSGDRPDLESRYVAPANRDENILANIFADVLGLEKVGAEDNFFDIGGDSIRSIRVLAKAKEQGLRFSLQQFFQRQTVRQLAALSDRASAEQCAPGAFDLVSVADKEKLAPGVVNAYPLASLQAGMIYHTEYNPESAIYHDVFSYHLRAPFVIDHIRTAAQALVERHPVLRTSFAVTGYSQPLQLVREHVEAPIEIVDLGELTTAQQEEALDFFVEQEKTRRFDWSRPPLFRLVVHRRGGDEFNLSLSFHHAILDGWSVATALTELFQHCYVLAGGAAPPLQPTPAVTFRDFIALEQSALGDESQRQYWRDRFRDSPETKLPRWNDLDATNAAVSNVGRQDISISQDIADALKGLARRAEVPLKSVLIAAHLRVLSLLTNQRCVVTGLACNGRPEETDGDRALGLFLNMLPLSFDVADLDWLSLTAKVYQLEQEYLPLRRFPLAEIQKDRDGPALFETAFNFIHFHVYEGIAELDGLEVLGARGFEQTNFALVVNFHLDVVTKQIHLALHYDGQEFSAAQMRAIGEYYRRTLTAMARNPEQQCLSASLLPDSEQQKVLVGWNNTARLYPRDKCVHELFEEQAENNPNRIALEFDNQCLTYRDLNHRADQLADLLREKGVGPEKRVGLCVERSLEMVVAFLGILKAGGAYVPLDPEYPQDRLRYMLEDCDLRVLITQEALVKKLPANSVEYIAIDIQWENIAQRDAKTWRSVVAPNGLAYVMYTSGSTGRPKGVGVTHRNVVRLVKETGLADLTADETMLQMAPISFDAATLELWGSLLNGGRLVIMPPGVPTLDEIGTIIRRKQITTVWLTAGLFHLIVDERLDDLKPLRQLIAGGDVLSVRHVKRVLKNLGDTRLINGYGPTEGTTFTCCHTISEADCTTGSVPIGRPIANSQVYVLDRDLNPVPIGTPGELYAAGDGVARGYQNRPALTAENFIPDPFGSTPGARLYKTGDRVRYKPNGVIEFLGREDYQVKIRGFRVELGEIEAVLSEHASVKDCVTMIRPIESNQKAIVAYLTSTKKVATTELQNFVSERLPHYMVPSVFVFLDALPLNVNGKVDRRALPVPGPTQGSKAFVTARTPTEVILEPIWREVLRVDRVSTETEFLELGGHSLLATQLVSRIRETLEIELPLRQLFETPTIAALAAHIDSVRAPSVRPIPAVTAISRDTDLPLSFAQDRLWFLYQLEPDNPFYNIPFALELRGQLDLEALRSSLSEIAQRHEVLRTRFKIVGGKPAQSVAGSLDVALPCINLQELSDDQRRAETERIAIEEARRTFDLSNDALVRAVLLERGPEDHVLLLTMHHIVADGWSIGVFVKELAALYPAFSSGAVPGPLPDIPVQYADFAGWQRKWLQGDVLQSQLDYWKAQLAGAPPYLELPTDRSRPPVQSFRGSSVQFEIGSEVTRKLNELSRKSNATLFMTLLSVFATFLSRYSRQNDVVIGSPVANRTRKEIENLIGFFVNTVALRVDLDGNPSFLELLDQVRQTALDAYAYQDLPFEKLVDKMQPERSLSQNPLFQVMFALQNAPGEPLELPGLNISMLNLKRTTAIFDLVLDVWETGDTLTGVMEFNTDLFDETTVTRMAGHFQTMLAAVASDPGQRVCDLPLLEPREREELLRVGGGPRVNYPVQRTIHELFEEKAAENPEHVAAVHNGSTISYSQLNQRANRIAHRLRRCGVRRNDLVGIVENRGIDFLASILGILKAGGAFVPLDPAYPEDRLNYMISDSHVSTIITRSPLRDRLFSDGELRSSKHFICLDQCELEHEDNCNPPSVSACTDLAYMLYTSGSTGLPKGAMVRHDGAINHMYAEFDLLSFDSDSAFLQSAPASSDISVWQFVAPMLRSGRTVIADFETVCDPRLLFEMIGRESVTLIELVPVVMKGLLDYASRLSPAERTLPRLQWAMVTGETVPVPLVNQWFEVYPRIKLVNAYGPTEAADDVTQHVIVQPLPADARTVPIGIPLANLTLYVLDANLQLVPEGVPGEICISGIGVGNGYWKKEELTNAVFVRNPFAAADRGDVLYRTGDLGRWLPGGILECLDRLDQQMKIRGFRIEAGEIETAIARRSWVHEAVVDVVSDPAGERCLVGYVVPSSESQEVRNEVDEIERERIGLWQELHESSYQESLDYGDPAFNVIGWDSNYTNAPLPKVELHEYVDFTVERILELKPNNVLEIGCGTGLIMFPLLPHCRSYMGTDLSGIAISRLQQLQQSESLQKRFAGLQQARLAQRRADDFQGLEDGRFDTVLLPSVVQYFPSIHYLLTVLQGIIQGPLCNGGSIFVGDVRHLHLLETFHASVQLYKTGNDGSLDELLARIKRKVDQEQELAIDPQFFVALRQRFSQIDDIEILPKRGLHHNEMTRFRYDVVIRVARPSKRGGHEAQPANSSLHHRGETEIQIDWSQDSITFEQIQARLANEAPSALVLRRVRNRRVFRDRKLVEWMAASERFANAGELKSALDELCFEGVEPEELWAHVQEAAYRVDISFANGYEDGSFDVVFYRNTNQSGAPKIGDEALSKLFITTPWQQYANNPLQEQLSRKLVPRLREALKAAVPSFMIPSDFVFLRSLPRTPVGKVDKKALPAPDFSQRMAREDYVAPRSTTEKSLAKIWSDVLEVEQVGIHSNFFDLGGHSLKATQVVSRIHRDLDVEVPLREIFNYPTIAELAKKISEKNDSTLARIEHQSDQEHYALSHAQRRLWVLTKMEDCGAAYNMPGALLLEGPIDVAAFQAAFEQVIQRHESLRTVFVLVGGEPRQKILGRIDSAIKVIDLTSAQDVDRKAEELARADAGAVFDLANGPLVRITLLRLAADRHVLLFNMHHIISDDWSMNVLVCEFVSSYEAFRNGGSSPLPDLAIQYRDYAVWQKRFLESDEVVPLRDYWHEKLLGDLPTLELPTDFPRPPVKTYRGVCFSFEVDRALTEQLVELGRRHYASLFMTLVAAVKVLLHRYTGQEDIIVGFPMAGRNHANLENQIGFYINMLPLRDQLSGDMTFASLLNQVQRTATGAFDHQAYPFDRLVEEVDLVRDVSRSPMFDVIVVLQNVDEQELTLNGVAVRPFADTYEGSKFDLSFTCEERSEGLLVNLVYNTDLFLPSRIEQISEHFRQLIKSIVSDAEMPIGRLNMLPAEERRRILRQSALKAESISAPPGRTLVEWFEEQAEKTPDNVAVVSQQRAAEYDETLADRRALTYRELNAQANRLARYLRDLGVGPDVLAGVLLNRSIDMVVGILGILKAGGAYVPFDPNHPLERIRIMLDDAGTSVLLSEQSLASRLAYVSTRTVCLDTDRALFEQRPSGNLDSEITPDTLAYVIYTSGSTGRPKGVQVTHHNVVRLFTATERWFSFGPNDVWTIFHSFAFDFSVWEMWGGLLYGGRVIVVPYWVSRSPSAFYKLLEAERVTVLNQTPSAFRQLIQVEDDADAHGQLELRYVIFGGEALDLPSLRPWFDLHGDEQPRLVNMYGITETTVHVTYRPISRNDLVSRASPIGETIGDLEIYLLDPYQQPVPIGITGEIYVGGAGVSLGYLNQAELTDQRFVAHPFSSDAGARLYRSGDLARRLTSGEIEYLGRIDQQVQIRGFRVELGEIEAVLASYPDVRDALVICETTNGRSRLIAYLVPADHDIPDLNALRGHLRNQLPNYMVPAAFITLDAFPLTANGKLDKKALPPPDGVRPAVVGSYDAPKTQIEKTITNIWKQVLQLDRIGVQENIFDLGAHSLHIVRVHQELQTQLGGNFSVVELFRHPTIAALAHFLSSTGSPTPSALETILPRVEKQRRAKWRQKKKRMDKDTQH